MIPVGVTAYSLTDTDTLPPDPTIYSGTFAQGISYRALWKTIEPTQGNYLFGNFDSVVQNAGLHNKKVMLRVLANGVQTPPYVLAGSQTFTAANGVTSWVPWDAFGLGRMNALFQAMGQRYGNSVDIIAGVPPEQNGGDWQMPTDTSGGSNWNILNSITCPAFNATVTCQAQGGQSVYAGWIGNIPGFGWFQVQSISGTHGNPGTITLKNLGYAGNASSGTIAGGTLFPINDVTAWQSPMYNYATTLLTNAIESGVNNMATSFPKAVVSLAVGRNGTLDGSGGDSDLNKAARIIATDMQVAWGNRFRIQKNGLAATSPLPPGNGTDFAIFNEVTTVRGFQTNWFTYGDNQYKNNGGTPADPLVVLQNLTFVGFQWMTQHVEYYWEDVVGLQNQAQETAGPTFVVLPEFDHA